MFLVLKRMSTVIMIMVMAAEATSQDIHFTHFRMAPLSVSPALTGSFRGTYRISAIYRDQWRSVQNSSPYKTPFISAEVNLFGDVLMANDWISGGISFVSDRTGSLNYKRQLTNLNVGYHISFDKDYSNVFSIGASYGSGTEGFNTLNVSTPSSLENNGVVRENFGADQEGNVDQTFSDLSIGVAYKTQINDQGDLFRIAITGAHLTAPNVSLIGGSRIVDPMNPNPIPNPDPNAGREVGLQRRMTLMAEASLLTTDKVRVNPALLYQTKGGFSELVLQGTADYLLDPQKGTVVTGGLGYRLNDAFELIGGIQIKDLRFGISYDLTTSSFTEAGGGAFELSVGYVGRIYKSPDVKPVIFCPRL